MAIAKKLIVPGLATVGVVSGIVPLAANAETANTTQSSSSSTTKNATWGLPPHKITQTHSSKVRLLVLTKPMARPRQLSLAPISRKQPLPPRQKFLTQQ